MRYAREHHVVGGGGSMLSLAIFSGSKIDGSELDPGERVVGLTLFGGLELDFTAVEDPLVDLVLVTVFGGVTVKVLPNQPVRLGGFSLFSGREVAPRQLRAESSRATGPRSDGSDELPLEISAYSLFGGVSVERELPPQIAPQQTVAR